MGNQVTIPGISDILDENISPDDELKQTVQDSLRKSLNYWEEKWNQCKDMTLLKNEVLRAKVVALAADKDKWFYIGYTSQELESMYLWDKQPGSKRFKKRKSKHNLVKSHTYYTRLTDLSKDEIKEEPKEESEEEYEKESEDESDETSEEASAEEPKLTEDSLIKLFVRGKEIDHKRCLNVQPYGLPKTKGIVYVLIYTKNS